MSESWQTGTPATEGWYECEMPLEIATVIGTRWWNGKCWYYDRNCKVQTGVEISRFRGPMVLLEPSQTAREAADKIVITYAHLNDWRHRELLRDDIANHITAAEQDAFQRGLRTPPTYEKGYAEGKKEGRREAAEKCKQEVLRLRQKAWKSTDGRDVGLWHGRANEVESLVEKILATDPPAQPAATELDEEVKHTIFRMIAGLEQRVERLEQGQ